MDKKEVIKNAVEFLEKELGQGKTYSYQQRLRLRDILLNQPDKAIENAVDWLILNSTPGNLPQPQRFLDSVEIERKKLCAAGAIERENQAERDRRESPTISQIQPSSELGREALRMVKKFFYVEVPYRAILAECENLGRKYPGTSFAQIAAVWRKDWTERGLV